MALHHNPRIVTAGLKMLLDPADKVSYPGTGTSMIDVSGNGFDASLNDGVTANLGYLHFVDSADDVSINIPLNIPREKTLTFWIRTNRPLSTADNFEIGFLNVGPTQGSMFGMMYGVGNCQDMGYWGYGASYDMSVEAVNNRWSSDGNWHSCTITMNSSRAVRVWIDGVRKNWLKHSDYGTVVSEVAMPIDTTNNFLINSRAGWNSGFTYVDIGQVAVYDRALSEDEIVHNYNVLKGRYAI